MPSVIVDDVTINYSKEGSGEPLVFFHGMYMSKESFKSQVDYFSKDYEVYSFDLPGQGASKETLKEYSVEYFAEVIYKAFGVLEIENVLVVGHSVGGMVAMRMAYHYDNVVSKLVLADSSYGTQTTIIDAIGSKIAVFFLRVMSIAKQAELFASEMGKKSRFVYEYLKKETLQYENIKEHYLNLWNSAISFNAKDEIAFIKCPTLIIAGADNAQTHAQARKMNELIPNSSLVFIANADHMVHMDKPSDFNESLSVFLKEKDEDL